MPDATEVVALEECGRSLSAVLALDPDATEISRGPFGQAGRFLRLRPVAAISLALLCALALIAIAAPVVAPYNPINTSAGKAVQAPSRAHLFGTDNLGRDVFSRTVWGARTSLSVGAVSVLLALALGAAVGLLSAYSGGTADMILMRLVDIVMSLPTLILALVIVAVLGPSVVNVIWAIALGYWPVVARVVRSSVLSLKIQTFIEAERTIGATPRRIILRHIVPNVMPLTIVYAATVLGGAILAEGGLSFLGVGTPPPQPSWGQDISGTGRTLMITAPWLVLFPALALSITILSVNLLADGLRDHLDPRLRSGR
ncbi:MAG: ABC transporter permease [Dehalococcoidia bacterium]